MINKDIKYKITVNVVYNDFTILYNNEEEMKIMNVDREILKIVNFIEGYVQEDEVVVIPISGGIDSDVTARLCCKALGKERIKLFIIKDDLEKKFIENARKLAEELKVSLTEISLEGKSLELMQILEKSEKDNVFNAKSVLEVGKAKCAYRSAIISCYQDKGYVIAGCTNRTEYELGFFVTFGDNLANFKPIQHLYKHEVIELANALGTDKQVIKQPPSAGFWEGQEDLEDIAYWIVNRGPILRQREFSMEEIERAENMKNRLNWEKIDTCLSLIKKEKEVKEITKITNLPEDMIEDIMEVIKKAKKYKSREILISL